MREKDPVLIILLIVAAVFIFANLGNIYLWEDEAETAQVAKNTIIFGYPRGDDGKSIIWVTGGFGPNFIWIYHTWLQFYLVAFSFLLLGFNTFAARFPFAVLGLLSIFLSYRLSLRLFEEKFVARLATLLLVFCVPFLLHLRQCRYYALTIFMVLLSLLAYLEFAENKQHSTLKLALCFILLFHSNHGAFIPVFLAVMLHYVLFHFKQQSLKRILALCALVFLFTFPFFLFLKGWQHGQGAIDVRHLRRHLEFYFRTINKYVVPLAFFSVVSMLYLVIKRRRPRLPENIAWGKLWLVILVIMVTIGFLLFVEQRHFRYIIYLVPLLLILEALILSRWYRINKWVTVAVVLTLVFSNALNNPKMRFPLFEFLYELTHDYDCPNEGIVKFLQENAHPADCVKVPYGGRPIMFYTDLCVDSRPFFEHQTFPEWIVYRRDWIDSRDLDSAYFQQIEKRYEKLTLNYPDIMWGNREEPGYHKFRTVRGVPGVIIYRRKD